MIVRIEKPKDAPLRVLIDGKPIQLPVEGQAVVMQTTTTAGRPRLEQLK